MIPFFQVISEFCSHPKQSGDITLEFFNFLEENYPDVWGRLNEFYADEEGTSPRLAHYGWDRILQPEYFPTFLQAIKSIWVLLVGSEFGVCSICKEEKALEIEHNPIVSWNHGYAFKIYENFEMDGSVFEEKLSCRECAMTVMKKLSEIVDISEVTCWT